MDKAGRGRAGKYRGRAAPEAQRCFLGVHWGGLLSFLCSRLKPELLLHDHIRNVRDLFIIFLNVEQLSGFVLDASAADS